MSLSRLPGQHFDALIDRARAPLGALPRLSAREATVPEEWF